MAFTDHLAALAAGKSVWQYRAEQLASREPLPQKKEGEEGAAIATRETTEHIETRGLTEQIGHSSHIISTRSIGYLGARGGSMSAQVAVRDGYEAAAIVFICVERIARACSSVPFDVQQRRRGNTWAPATSTEAGDIRRVINKPNVSWPRSEYIWRLMQHLLLTGNAITRETRFLTRKGIAELWLLDPDGVRVKPKNDGTVDHYTFTQIGRKQEKIDPEFITHIQLPHPLYPHWGMSPLTAAAKGVDLDLSALDWQRHTLGNQGMPSGLVSTKDTLQQEAYDHRRKKIKEDIEGPKNAGRILFMDADSKYSPLSLTATELAYLESREFTREELCAVYGVPPPVAGFYEAATYNNVENARLIFWIQTVIPYLNMVAENLTASIQAVYGDKYRLNPNLTGVQALAPLYRERLKQGLILRRMGYTPDEVNERLDLGMPMIGNVRDGEDA